MLLLDGQRLSIFLIQDISKVGLLEDFTTMGKPTVAGKRISVKRYENMEILRQIHTMLRVKGLKRITSCQKSFKKTIKHGTNDMNFAACFVQF